MRKISLAATVACTLAVAGTALTSTATAAPAADDLGSGRYIVVLEDGVAARAVAAAHTERFGLDLGHVYTSALKGYSATMPSSVATVLEKLPTVAWVQRDGAVSTTAQSTPSGINRANADASPTAAINGSDERVDVDVAVIDTGVDLDHTDLNVNRAGARNCSLLSLSANDGNGHGTHVAGTIGALDNGAGVVGMAPGARIWPVKVLSDLGTGFNSDVICGIDYVAANAASIEVANMSLGGSGTDGGSCGATSGDAMHAAICEAVSAGVTFVVAAGNDAADAAGFTPAAYDEVITVSALADFNGLPGGGAAATCRDDVDDTFASFSNHGSDVDIIAPGVCITSTWNDGTYNTISGTSMASPHVAGGAALYAAKNPDATPVQVKAALQNAGSLDWDNSDDLDSTKERLLDVSVF